MVHQIEAVLDILQEETERHAQQKVPEHGGKTVTKHPVRALLPFQRVGFPYIFYWKLTIDVLFTF